MPQSDGNVVPLHRTDFAQFHGKWTSWKRPDKLNSVIVPLPCRSSHQSGPFSAQSSSFSAPLSAPPSPWLRSLASASPPSSCSQPGRQRTQWEIAKSKNKDLNFVLFQLLPTFWVPPVSFSSPPPSSSFSPPPAPVSFSEPPACYVLSSEETELKLRRLAVGKDPEYFNIWTETTSTTVIPRHLNSVLIFIRPHMKFWIMWSCLNMTQLWVVPIKWLTQKLGGSLLTMLLEETKHREHG